MYRINLTISCWLKRLIAGLALLFLGQAGYALELSDGTRNLNLTPYLQYVIDPSNSLKLPQVSQLGHDNWKNAEPSAIAGINFGNTDAAIWLKFELKKSSDLPAEWVLEIPYTGLNQADLYLPDGTLLSNGTLIPPSARPYHSRFYAFPISVTDKTQPFYIKVRSSYPITIPLHAVERLEHNRNQFSDNLLQAIYYGGLLALLCYNLVLYLIIKDSKYLIYSLFTGFTGLGIFAGNGYAQLYLWPLASEWNEISQTVLLSIGGALAMLFTMRFLKTHDRLPYSNRLMKALAYLYGLIALLLIASLWLPLSRPLLYQSMFLISLFAPAFAVYVSVRVALAGNNSAVYFLVSWSVFCFGAIIAALRLLELIPSNSFTLYAIQISSGIEMLLFSFALAYRFQFERLRREEAQTAVLAAKEEVIKAISASEERLEKAVDERTLKLQKLLLSEQHMREQYVRFGALIAHEFRNPLNNIAAQASILEMDPAPSHETIRKRTGVIRSSVNRLTALFDQWLESDRLNTAVNEMHSQTIVLASLLDEVMLTCTPYHIEHNIELLSCPDGIKIDGDEHLLQIALHNLIDNACKYSPDGSTIRISTESRDNTVGICIKDSGCGISSDQIEAVLEPYARGQHNFSSIKGVGLGLAFVNRIVQLHHGRIVIDSEPGSGTSITLWLPALN